MKKKNLNLNKARTAKNDEFYTLYEDIEREIFCYITDSKKVRVFVFLYHV